MCGTTDEPCTVDKYENIWSNIGGEIKIKTIFDVFPLSIRNNIIEYNIISI